MVVMEVMEDTMEAMVDIEVMEVMVMEVMEDPMEAMVDIEVMEVMVMEREKLRLML